MQLLNWYISRYSASENHVAFFVFVKFTNAIFVVFFVVKYIFLYNYLWKVIVFSTYICFLYSILTLIQHSLSRTFDEGRYNLWWQPGRSDTWTRQLEIYLINYKVTSLSPVTPFERVTTPHTTLPPAYISEKKLFTHSCNTHTHICTHAYIYIYIYIH